MAIVPVIMAGGSGTRFWPLSRKAKPKQFLALTGKKAMIAETLERVKGLAPTKDCFVVCGGVHAKPAAKLLKGRPKGNVLVEPEARNTAPAIALACAHVDRRDPTGVLVVMPSDQTDEIEKVVSSGRSPQGCIENLKEDAKNLNVNVRLTDVQQQASSGPFSWIYTNTYLCTGKVVAKR